MKCMRIIEQMTLAILFFVHSSCTTIGDKSKSHLSSIGALSSDEVVIVSRVEIDPLVSGSGRVLSGHRDDVLTVVPSFTICNKKKTERKNSSWVINKNCYREAKRVEVGQFYAIKIRPTKKFTWFSVTASIHNRGFFSKLLNHDFGKASGTFHSWIRGFYFTSKHPLQGGKTYYAGTIRIKLSSKSYFELGDEQYDKSQVQYLIPDSVTIDMSARQAKQWAKNELNYSGKLIPISFQSFKSPLKSEYEKIKRY